MDDEGLAIGIIALVLALAGLGLVLSLPAGISSTGLLFTNGTRPLTANWDAGSHDIKALSFTIGADTLTTSEWFYLDGQDQFVNSTSNVNFGSITLGGNLILGANTVTTSNTSLITNLNADLLDSQHGSYYRNATNINAGTLSLTYIPTMDDAHIPNLETLSYGGAFAVAQVPSLDASKVTTGQFATARIPTLTLSASNISSGTFGTSRLDLSALAQNIVFTSTQTVDGIDVSAYLDQAVLTTSAPTFGHLHLGGLIDGITTISMSGQLTNMLAVGTAPFAITSTTKVANLNVEQVDGYDLDQALLIASSPTFAHIHSSAIGSVLTGSGAGYGGTPSLLIEDTSTRATLVMNTITDNALDITFKTNNAIHWDISARSSGNNYDLIFYRWKTVTPCITLSYDTGLVTLEGSLKIGSIITMPNEGALWWTNSSGYDKNIMRLNGANNMIMNTQPSKSWIWYSSAPDYYANFVIYDSGNVDVRSVFTASGGVVTKYMSGDYGLTWTQTMPTGINGMTVTVYNSNAGILSSRWYVYTNGVWRWSALT